jgi:hypothetical protein
MADKLQGVWVAGKYLTSRKALLARAATWAAIARNAIGHVPDSDPRKPALRREVEKWSWIAENRR